MKRFLGLLLLLGAMLIATPQSASTVPQGLDSVGAGANQLGITMAEERRGFFWRRRHTSRPAPDMEPNAFKGKGVGARFWGGPYWGYGARLGHPCDNCRSACTGGERSIYCDRCRMRCGW